MKARWGTVALLAALAACGSSAASSGTRAGSAASSGTQAGSSATTPTGVRHCGPPGAVTLGSSPQARVYSWHGGVFGCSFSVRRSFRLGRAERSIGESRVGPVAVAGELAAFGLQRFGVDSVLASVVVRRLTDGAQLKQLQATRTAGGESFDSVGSVVLRANGSVAWIASQTSIPAGRRGVIEVHAAGAGGDRILDSGRLIDPTSLRLHGSRLSWMDGGATRHATLR